MTLNNKEIYKYLHHSLLRSTDSMLHLLQKGKDFAREANKDESEMLEAKLAPDMFNFTKQVQVFTDNVAGAIARSASMDKPSFPDTETTFSELIIRTQKVKDFILSINPDTIDGFENLKIKLGWMPPGMYFSGATYLGNFVMQNCLFHLVTAYAIMRHNGVQIGKQDYMGPLEMGQE